MKCPNCSNQESFRVQAWEVNSFTAYVRDGEITDTKHDETWRVALEPESLAFCLECGHESELSTFGSKYPLPLQARPDFESSAELDGGEDQNGDA